MNKHLALSVVLFTQLVCGAGQAADTLSEDALLQIRFEQRLNNQVGSDLQFRDESGRVLPLGSFFRQRPVILVLGYYSCPMLCSVMLNGLLEAMQDLKLEVGKQFDVVCVSIDPQEKPDLALAKKRMYLKRYGRRGAENGWHFLTGDDVAINKLADEVGFHYAYDARSRQFAHPSGLVILTPDGRISRYLFGVTYSAGELDSALREATLDRIGSSIQQLLLLCFHYNPITGKFGKLIVMVVRICGVLTLVALGYVLLRLRPNHRSSATGPPL